MSESKKIIKCSKKRKPKRINYCNICRKYFSTSAYQKVHMIKYHEGKICENDVKFVKQLSANNKKFWINNTIFNDFENELSLELKNDKFRCIICSKISANPTEHMEHEKIHYQTSNITNNVIVQESSCTNNAAVSLVVNNFGGISCILCKYSFTSLSDFKKHKKKKECKISKRNNRKNSFHCEDNEENLQKKDDRQRSRKKNKKNRNKVNGHETQAKVLKQLVSQKFDCIICKTLCECLEHFQAHKWWWESKTPVEFTLFECYVCNELFTEEKEFKTHETDHILKNIC